MLTLRRAIRLFAHEPLHELAFRPTGQVPALDALRTCAVLMVIAHHGAHEYVTEGSRDNAFASLPFVSGGWMGVDLFFVLSGYFIGKQLWRELGQTGSIRLGQFALRRGLRIWPLYFFFIAVIFLGQPGYAISEGRWSDPVFLTNYFYRGLVPGSWSLCTEEQFYLLAPLLLLLGFKRTKSVEGFRPYLAVCLILLPAVRAVAWWHLSGSPFTQDHAVYHQWIGQPIHTHADGLILGLFLSNLETTTGGRWKQGFVASLWFLVVVLGVAAFLYRLQPQIFNYTAVTLLFGATVWYLLSRQRSSTLLNAWVFYVLSRLSYGMYLNHRFFQHFAIDFGLQHIPLGERLPALHNFATFLVQASLSAGAALVTFCMIEYPFLRIRECLLSRRKSLSAASPPTAPLKVEADTAKGLFAHPAGAKRLGIGSPPAPR